MEGMIFLVLLLVLVIASIVIPQVQHYREKKNQ